MLKKDWAFLGVICLLSLLFMLPRILSAQFGLLDDGVLLLSAQAAIKDIKLILYQYQTAGRFLPTVLIIRALVFRFAGFSAVLWYLWSALQAILAALILFFIARKYQGSHLQIMLCVLIFLASPSAVESFYTLSKAEVLLILCISGAILCALYYPSLKSRFAKIICILSTFFLLLLSFGAKETAIVLPFMFLGWLLISWLTHRKHSEYSVMVKSDLILLIGSLVSGAVYWLLRYSLGISGPAGAYSGGYQLLNLEKLSINFSTLLGWIIRDYPYLIPVFLSFLFIRPLRIGNTLAFNLKWILWLVVWAGVLLPWYILAYYMLPFQFGAALLSGMTIGHMAHLIWPKWKFASSDNTQFDMESAERKNNIISMVLILLTFLLFIPPVVNTSAYAIEQLSLDRANWRFIKKMVALPRNSRLIIDMPAQLEYFREIELMVYKLYGREDISIEAYNPPIELVGQENIYIASLIHKNQVIPGVRSNHGDTLAAWNTCLENESIATKKYFSAKIIRPILDIGLHRILPLKMDILLGADRDIFVYTTFTYGWDVVQFIPTKPHADKPGVFNKGIFKLQTISGKIRTIAFGQGNEIPLSGDLDGDGYSDLVLYDVNDRTWSVDYNLDGKEDQVFRINNMSSDDIPLLGDWDGDGKVTPGLFKPSDSNWYLFSSLSGDIGNEFQLGLPTDLPLVGDWNGDGNQDIGGYRPDSGYIYLITDPNKPEIGIQVEGTTNGIPVAGFWDATTKNQIALVKDNSWTIYIPVFGCILPNPHKDIQFDYPGIPLAGVWKDQ